MGERVGGSIRLSSYIFLELHAFDLKLNPRICYITCGRFVPIIIIIIKSAL